MSRFNDEIARGERFRFGRNWRRFLSVLDEERIAAAEASLHDRLGTETLVGKDFLDAGSGSGLFSLAARRMEAKVHSFDYDPESVACTAELKRRYYPDDAEWRVEEGSVLDCSYLQPLGTFDVVYSWGVLHHTGDMWRALENVASLVRPRGQLFLSIYNHQVYWTALSSRMKRAYVRSSCLGKSVLAVWFVAFQVLKGLLKDLVFLRNPLARYKEAKRNRGMSMWHNWLDWLGGYPFETAKPEEVFDFYRKRGFVLERLKTCGGGHGCNEFVFRKASDLRE